MIDILKKHQINLAFAVGLIIGGAAIYAYWAVNTESDSHGHSDDIHYHSDLVVYMDGEQLRFTDDKYQSRTGHILANNVHLHDGNDDVIHFHDEGVSLAEFFSSLSATLTNDCFTTDAGQQFCEGDGKSLRLFVNGEIVEDIASYVPADLDRMLLYYGTSAESEISELNTSISDRSCMYSGSCPERGTPPPEECGLTCEL